MSDHLPDEEWVQGRADEEAHFQVQDALRSMARPATDFLRWPWADLDAMTGGMGPGTTHYVVGFSGMGKTTFICSALDRWAKAGIGIDVLPLELKPDTFRAYMACQAAGIDPGLMMSGDYKLLPNADDLFKQARAALIEQKARQAIRVHEAAFVDVEKLEAACSDAQIRGAQVVVVDHIDHVSAEGKSDIQISHAVNKAAFRIAKEYNLVLILMSQANNDALKVNNDHLAKFQPLRETSVWMGALKRQVCTSMLGLFRPVRAPLPGETPDEYKLAMHKAKSGEEPPGSMLIPQRAGLNLMKSRNYGAREGQRVQLAVRHGYYDDLNDSERLDTQARTHGIRTSSGLRLERPA